jgi:hypothetical protein
MLCNDCKDAGQSVIAYHVLRSGTRLCELHFRQRMGQPAKPAKATEEKKMAVKAIDWEAVQRDRDAGIPVSQLEKKYGVSNPTIYTRTHGSNGKSNGNGHAGGAKPDGRSRRMERMGPREAIAA